MSPGRGRKFYSRVDRRNEYFARANCVGWSVFVKLTDQHYPLTIHSPWGDPNKPITRRRSRFDWRRRGASLREASSPHQTTCINTLWSCVQVYIRYTCDRMWMHLDIVCATGKRYPHYLISKRNVALLFNRWCIMEI